MNFIFSQPSYAFVLTWYKVCIYLYQRYRIFHSAVHELFDQQCNAILRGCSKLFETVMKITSTDTRPFETKLMDFGCQSHTSVPLSIVGFALSYDVDFPLAEKKRRTWLEATCCIQRCCHNVEIALKLKDSNLIVNIGWEIGGKYCPYTVVVKLDRLLSYKE